MGEKNMMGSDEPKASLEDGKEKEQIPLLEPPVGASPATP